jgi:hypothetical protein
LLFQIQLVPLRHGEVLGGGGNGYNNGGGGSCAAAARARAGGHEGARADTPTRNTRADEFMERQMDIELERERETMENNRREPSPVDPPYRRPVDPPYRRPAPDPYRDPYVAIGSTVVVEESESFSAGSYPLAGEYPAAGVALFTIYFCSHTTS